MEKKQLSYRKQIMNFYVFNGISWIVAGISNCFSGKVFSIISIIALLIGTFFTMSIFVKNRQAPDEMARSNMNEAITKAYFIGYLIALLFYLIFGKVILGIIGLDVNLNKYLVEGLLAFIGFLNVIIGITFKKLEEE